MASPDPCGSSIYAPDFFLETPEPWLVFQEEHICSRSELLSLLRRFPRESWRIRGDCPPDRASFRRQYEAAREGFSRGLFDKIVPYGVSELQVAVGPAQIAHALERLLELPAPLLPYGFWLPGGGLLGATPELLLERRGRELLTCALAGTRRRGSAQRSLLEDPKQLREHELVVEDLLRELSQVGRVDAGAVELIQLPYLEHLRTPITVDLFGPDTLEGLVQRLHPTPALGSSPRGAGEELLRELERELPRGRFGAPFGWRTASDDGLLAVAIRNVQWRGDGARIATGCGLVPASRFEDEWNELQDKQRAIRRLLGLG